VMGAYIVRDGPPLGKSNEALWILLGESQNHRQKWWSQKNERTEQEAMQTTKKRKKLWKRCEGDY